MNLNELNQKLLAVARRHAPSDQVPYAFEKRILAHLAARPLPDNILLWGQALWRAAIPCAAVVLLIGVGSLLLPADNPATTATATTGTELAQDFQDTLLAAVDQTDPADPLDQNEEL